MGEYNIGELKSGGLMKQKGGKIYFLFACEL